MHCKACRKCGAEKPLADYYVHKAMADGHLNICKECTRSRVTNHRDSNIERIREYDRLRGGRQAGTGYKSPTKLLSSRSGSAIKSGKLKKPQCCTAPGCFSTDHIEAHHPDFCKPLSVVWLCRKCHKTLHKEYGRYTNAKD